MQSTGTLLCNLSSKQAQLNSSDRFLLPSKAFPAEGSRIKKHFYMGALLFSRNDMRVGGLIGSRCGTYGCWRVHSGADGPTVYWSSPCSRPPPGSLGWSVPGCWEGGGRRGEGIRVQAPLSGHITNTDFPPIWKTFYWVLWRMSLTTILHGGILLVRPGTLSSDHPIM